jgi:hypothetical protein
MEWNSRAAWSIVAGVLSVAVLPAAVVATRYSEAYELLHAGFAIPVAFALGLAAVALARKAGGGRAALTGQSLGLAGLWLSGAAAIAIGVFELADRLSV